MMKHNKQALEMLESNWLKNQVENHLIFGPLSKGGIVLWGGLIFLGILTEILINGVPTFSSGNFGSLLNFIYAAVIVYIFYKMPSYHRAAALWCVVKFTLFIITFIMLVAGGLGGFFSGKPDAIHITVLALVWVPGLEFLSRFSKKQKIITTTKILVSIPIVYLWYKTGTWY